MVEIIRRGPTAADQSYVVTCRPGCGTEFRFFAREAEPYDDRDGKGFKIPCPVCNKMVWKNI